MQRRTCLALSAVILILANVAASSGGCVSDCRDNYEAEVENCKLLYDDPDDADSLQMCIDEARHQYDDCVDECQS